MEWAKTNVKGVDEWVAGMKRLLDQEGILYKGEWITLAEVKVKIDEEANKQPQHG